MSTGWEEILDELESRVQAHRAVLEGAQAPSEPFAMPFDAGDLPPHLHARARRILDSQRELEQQLLHRMAGLKALAAHWSHHVDPVYLDRSA